jgi:hypothetical protein
LFNCNPDRARPEDRERPSLKSAHCAGAGFCGTRLCGLMRGGLFVGDGERFERMAGGPYAQNFVSSVLIAQNGSSLGGNAGRRTLPLEQRPNRAIHNRKRSGPGFRFVGLPDMTGTFGPVLVRAGAGVLPYNLKDSMHSRSRAVRTEQLVAMNTHTATDSPIHTGVAMSPQMTYPPGPLLRHKTIHQQAAASTHKSNPKIQKAQLKWHRAHRANNFA